MSSQPSRIIRSVVVLLALVATAFSAHAQYPGHIRKDADTGPTLRASAVFEWTGDFAKPTAGRLIPLAVWDGEQFQPGGLYLAQPAPLAVLTGTVYELEKDGLSRGLFNVSSAENLGGSWIGIGSVKPELAPIAKARAPMSKHPPQVVKESGTGTSTDSDRPTLHRKDTGTSSTSSTSSGTSSTSASTPPPADPDHPTLHRRDSSDSSSTSSTSDSSGTDQSTSNSDPDRPALHRRDSDNAQSTTSVDPDRPTLHKRTDSTANPTGAPVTSTANVDPDRPMLRHGKPEAPVGIVEPSKLEGVPADMNQMVAISDAKPTEPHPYAYSWSDPDDQAKMKLAMEKLAQETLAGTPPPASTTAAKPPAKTTTTRRKTAAKPKPQLPLLEDQKFNAFELSYSGGATLVFTARTDAAVGSAKYVTLIAQPDFYGVPQVIFKQVTSDERLDIIPRMRLVDAADTDADRRAELIFELRSKTGREFAIYRVVNSHVEQAFNTGPLP